MRSIYSEATGQLIDEEVRKIIDHAFIHAKAILTDHRSSLIKLAGLLQPNEIIFKKDLENILGSRQIDKHQVVRDRIRCVIILFSAFFRSGLR